MSLINPNPTQEIEQRVEAVQIAASQLPGAGTDWRIIRRGDAFILQTKSIIGGMHWANAQGSAYATLTDALEVAIQLFSVDVQVWPVLQ